MDTLDNNSTWDLIVIGGGAAGYFGAISAAEHAERPMKIAILEKTAKVLNKVKISGGGRCNVTHDCLEPKPLSTHYPRGEKSLIGSFHQFGPVETIAWFQEKGVELKVEKDGRMFPVTDNSQTIIDCLTDIAGELGIETYIKTSVEELKREGNGFSLLINKGLKIQTKCVLLSTGGTRLAAGAKLAEDMGHSLTPAVPSLFTFSIDHPLIRDLEGVSVNPVDVKIQGTKFKNSGPLLVTHWGVSGPGILKLSALAARELASCNYTFILEIDWCPGLDLSRILSHKRQEWGKRQIHTRSPLASIPKRLWSRFCEQSGISSETTWAQLTKKQDQTLTTIIHETILPVSGKSINKDEFVTCGGVELKEMRTKTMESKISDNLHFAGEVLNIDGVTGGFNFQNAWTGGHLAGKAIAEKLSTAS